MKIYLAAQEMLALLSTLVFFIIFIVRAIKKQNKKLPGIITLISFGFLITAAVLGSQLYPTEDKKMQTLQEYPQKLPEKTDKTQKDAEIIITPKNGKKMKVKGKTLNFRIDSISVNDSNINIQLFANGEIPLEGMDSPVKMRIEMDKKVYESSNIDVKGILSGVQFGNDGIIGNEVMLLGYLVFEFSTTKIPDAVIVYNNENKSIKFKVNVKDKR